MCLCVRGGGGGVSNQEPSVRGGVGWGIDISLSKQWEIASLDPMFVM